MRFHNCIALQPSDGQDQWAGIVVDGGSADSESGACHTFIRLVGASAS